MFEKIKKMVNTHRNKKVEVLKLPDELLLNIFSFLGSKTNLHNTRLACERFSQIGADKHVGHIAYQPNYFKSHSRYLKLKHQGAFAVSYNKTLAYTDKKEGLCLYDIFRNKITKKLKSHRPYHHLQFSPDGNFLIAAPDEFNIEVWHLNTQKLLYKKTFLESDWYRELHFPDNSSFEIRTSCHDPLEMNKALRIDVFDLLTGSVKKSHAVRYGYAMYLASNQDLLVVSFNTLNQDKLRIFDYKNNLITIFQDEIYANRAIISSDKSRLITYFEGAHSGVEIFDLQKMSKIASFPRLPSIDILESDLSEHTNLQAQSTIRNIKESDDGKYLIISMMTKYEYEIFKGHNLLYKTASGVLFLDKQTGQIVRQLKLNQNSDVHTRGLSPHIFETRDEAMKNLVE